MRKKHCQRILIRITVIEDLTVKAEDKNMFGLGLRDTLIVEETK